MNSITSLTEFIYNLMYDYPKSVTGGNNGEIVFVTKYKNALSEKLEQTDFDKLYSLILKNNPQVAFAPSPEFILEMAKQLKTDGTKCEALVKIEAYRKEYEANKEEWDEARKAFFEDYWGKYGRRHAKLQK